MTRQPAFAPFAEFGQKLEKLGLALQDPKCTINQATSLARAAGLRLVFEVTVPETPDGAEPELAA